MKRHIVFIVNGSRKLKASVSSVMDGLKSDPGLSVEILTTKYEKHATELAKKKADEGCELLIAVGGDGTCNEVVNGIMQASTNAVRFGILPNGTGNDFHKALGEFNPEKFRQAVLNGVSSPIDIIELNGKNGQSYSLNIAGAGFDGYVVNLLDRQREKWKLHGKSSYALAIVRAFLSYRKPVINFKSEEFNYVGKALMVVMCNGKMFGHGLVIHPEAEIDDGQLGVTLLGDVSLFDYVRHLSDLKKGRIIQHEKIHYFPTKEVHISADRPLFVETDGEVAGETPLTIRIVPAAINFLQSI